MALDQKTIHIPLQNLEKAEEGKNKEQKTQNKKKKGG